MKKLFFIPAILLAAVSCDGVKGPDQDPVKVEPAEPIELSTRQATKLSADNTFAFGFFRETVTTADDKTNAFVSPLSLTMALGMLYNGTSPEAGVEMAAALGMEGFSAEEINGYYQTMGRALLAVDPLTKLSIANSIWSREGYPVKPAFYDINRTFYDAEVQSRDFGLPATLKDINGWCAQKTYGRIPKILDMIPANAVMYLINAVYFKSQWAFEFDKADTRDEDFTLAGGGKQSVKMMNQIAHLSYYQNDELKCVDLPYGNGAFSMMVVMPLSDGEPLDDLIGSLDAGAYNEISAGLRPCEVRLKLPRFKQECGFDLIDAVKNLGIDRIFVPGNLGGIADDPSLFVSMIKQKTFVEVNEQGTEAAAVTAIGIAYTSIGPHEPLAFNADRPFVYIIREKSTGAILFIGRMDEPKI